MCASALLEAGHEVTLIDVGRALPAPAARAAKALAQKDVDRWTRAEIDAARGATVTSDGIPRHLSFGSDYAYANDDELGIVQQDCHCTVSHAKGGFSAIWGGSVLPNRAEDFETWPVTLPEMVPHYKAVGEIMGIAAAKDDPLLGWFPHYAEPLPAPRRSAQAEHVRGTSERHAEKLARRGMRVGGSRLALRTRPDGEGRQCRNVGLCLTGCPFSAIYSTDQTLERLMKDAKFRYVGGHKAERLEEGADGVTIVATRVEDGTKAVFSAERVYLGCGALASAMLMAASLPGASLSLPVVYQPYVMIPLLLLKNFPGAPTERLHTLNQLNIELEDEKISAHPLHLQLYTFNHFIEERLDRILRFFPFVRGFLRRLTLGRVVTLQGYAHGDAAAPIRVEFAKTPQGGVTASLKGPSDDARLSSLASAIVRKLARSSREFGMAPIPFMRILGTPGAGSHFGSIFPMRERPDAFETDRLGRLPGHPRIHLIDGAVLTTIPAATITYTIMANAHRIGAESASL